MDADKAKKQNQITYQHFLISEFEVRKSKNASYSLRTFARDLGLAAPKLSEILRGKCGLSQASAERIAVKLGLLPEETKLFINLVNAKHARSQVLKDQAIKKLNEANAYASFNELSLETFKIISDWHHFAILELTEVKDFKDNAEWISERLGLSIEKTQEALERLLDFGLLEIKSKMVQTKKSLSTPSGVPSREIKKHHQQILTKAEQSLIQDPISTRDFSTMTMAIPESAFAEIQNEIKKFRREISNKYLNNTNKERVYCLSMQLFPLDVKMEEDVL